MIAAGLIQLILKLKGQKLEKVDPLPDNMVRLTVGDTNMDVPVALLRLYQDVSVRAAAQKVIEEPLRKEGFETSEIREKSITAITITKADSVYFVRPQIPDATLIDDVRRSAFSIISLAFKEDNKWRLNDGTNAISRLLKKSSPRRGLV